MREGGGREGGGGGGREREGRQGGRKEGGRQGGGGEREGRQGGRKEGGRQGGGGGKEGREGGKKGRIATSLPIFCLLPSDFKTCSVVENGCEVRYQVHQLVTGDEDMIVVYFNRNQSDAKTLRSDPGE